MHQVQSFTLATALVVACIGGSATSAQTRPPDQPAAKSGAATSDDQQFVQKAAASGQMEVQQGKMAASKASNAQVKAFGNMLVKDHTAANQQLMAIAKRKKIAMTDDRMVHNQASPAGGSATSATSDTKAGGKPASTSQTTGTTGASGGVATTGEARDRQAGMSGQPGGAWMSATGNAFDRGFLDAQVKAHQEAIALFEKQANGGADSDLKAFAQKQLPGLRHHLKQAQDLQAKVPSTD